MLYKFIILYLVFHSVALIGGQRVGNSADLLVCDDSVELLDFAESEINFLTMLDFKNLETEQIIVNVLSRLYDYDPLRAQLYTRWWKEFRSKKQELDPFDYESMDSGRTIETPKNCRIQQLVYQLRTPTKSGIRFLFNKVLWDSNLSNRLRAGVFLHEIVLREMIALGQKKNENTRLFTNWLFSSEFDDLGKGGYEGLLRQTGLMSLDAPPELLSIFNFLDLYVANIKWSVKSKDFKIPPETLGKVTKYGVLNSLSLVGQTISFEIQEYGLFETWNQSDIFKNQSDDERTKVTKKFDCTFLESNQKTYCEMRVSDKILSQNSRPVSTGELLFDESKNKLSLNLKTSRPEEVNVPGNGNRLVEAYYRFLFQPLKRKMTLNETMGLRYYLSETSQKAYEVVTNTILENK